MIRLAGCCLEGSEAVSFNICNHTTLYGIIRFA